MSKEMPILFVYDTLHCQTEHDDPTEAVLYFHPSWVSDQQRLALCGQLMGTTYFLKSVFSCPNIIELKSGKFVIKTFGRYILAVGTDRNIANSILLRKTEILSSLLFFYHYNILYSESQLAQAQKDVMDKVARNKIADKLYQIFETYLPILQYGCNIFQNVPMIRLPKSNSNVFLQAVQILQSCRQNTSVLGGTILYHNKIVSTQLSPDITKYLVLTDPHHIKSPAEIVSVQFHLPVDTQILVVYIEEKEYRRLQKDGAKGRSLTHEQKLFDKTFVFKNNKEPMKSTLKRDNSIIFSTVPEEDVEQSISTKAIAGDSDSTNKDNKNNIIFPQKFNRPTHLPLRFKNVTTRDLPDSGLGIDRTDEEESIPEFKGQTSVCSTPMSDLNKILHGRAMSICGESEKTATNLEKKDIYKNSSQLKELRDNFLSLAKDERRSSLPDLRETTYQKGFPMRTYGFGLSKFSLKTEEKYDKAKLDHKERNRTRSEPCYSVLPSDNFLITEIENHSNMKFECSSKIEALSSKLEPVGNSSNLVSPTALGGKERVALDRSKMTLPLHSKTPVSTIPLTPLMTKLTILSTLQDTIFDNATPETAEKDIICETPTTPSKCNSQILKEKKMICETPTTPLKNNSQILGKIEPCLDRKRVHLLVCGQRNMTLLLLLENGAGLNEQLVLEMWETCVGHLPRLESRLRDSLGAIEPDQIALDSEHGYSFISLDPQWETVNRSGPWAPADMTSLNHMHSDLASSTEMVELILRSDESILYGHQCGLAEVYYQQPAEKRAGIPPPADPMGSVQIRARRRLERDHAIVLL